MSGSGLMIRLLCGGQTLADEVADQHHQTSAPVGRQILPSDDCRSRGHGVLPPIRPRRAAPDGPLAVSMEPHVQRFHVGPISIGFKSANKRQEQKPGSALLQTLRGLLALVDSQVVEDHHVALATASAPAASPYRSRRSRRVIGPSITHGAVSPVQRRPAMKVWVSQCPNGALAYRRWPLRERPRRPGHLRGRAGLIEKHEPMRLLLHARLAFGAPVLACLAHVGASLFAGPQRFF